MSLLKEFINKESISGILLIIFTGLALCASNSQFSPLYNHFLDITFTVQFNETGLSKPIFLWINDGLMAIFFLLVGLELKREALSGELREYDKTLLPISGAIGGMLIPVLVFHLIAMKNPAITHAWAIPMATDIAFALGVLALFGKRVSVSLKLFLMTLAIIDDLGAIVVIALFHTEQLSLLAFLLALLCLLVLVLFNRLKISVVSPYLFVGLIMWLCVLKSGFHATLTGVLLAMTIPMQSTGNVNVLTTLEHDIHPVVAFIVLPLFAFANAGVPFAGISLHSLTHPLIVAIVVGLVVGKIIGITGFTLLAKNVFKITATFTNMQLLAVAALCGIGFTMSLFIAGLSFGDNESLLNLSRVGILLGSLISVLLGSVLLYLYLPKAE